MDALNEVCFDSRCVGLYKIQGLANVYLKDLKSIVHRINKGKKIKGHFLENIRQFVNKGFDDI